MNLVHFTALRQRDVRALQRELTDVGATSMASSEADVQAKVLAARHVVVALRGGPPVADLDTFRRARVQGGKAPEAHSSGIFGPMSDARPTRIMVTLPSEASAQPELVSSFVRAGIDLGRVNCGHDDPPSREKMAELESLDPRAEWS